MHFSGSPHHLIYTLITRKSISVENTIHSLLASLVWSHVNWQRTIRIFKRGIRSHIPITETWLRLPTYKFTGLVWSFSWIHHHSLISIESLAWTEHILIIDLTLTKLRWLLRIWLGLELGRIANGCLIVKVVLTIFIYIISHNWAKDVGITK